MMTPHYESGLAQQPWLREFLQSRGFQVSGANTFSNGRASLQFNGHQLVATPADNGRVCRSDLRGAHESSVCLILTQLLLTPGFSSHAALERQATRRQSVEAALEQVAAYIRDNPETRSGRELRRFLWSLFNQHHAVNLWSLKDALDSRGNASVTEILTGWMDGCVSESQLRRALVESGEMERWDTARLQMSERRRLTDAVDAVNDLLVKMPPGAPVPHLSRASTQLLEVMESLKLADRSIP